MKVFDMETSFSSQSAKQFCIVYDKDTLPMANSLYNRVLDKGYSCVTWSEEQYHDQKAVLENDAQSNKMLFLSKKCVQECFSNPKIKPIVVNDWGRLYQEGINVGIGLVDAAEYMETILNDRFILWSMDKKGRRIIMFVPAFVWGLCKSAYKAITPSDGKDFKRKVFWNVVEVFYTYYLDSFMLGETLNPIDGVTEDEDQWNERTDYDLGFR